MMLLSKEKLKRLEALWEDYPDGLNMTVFANIIMDSIECSQEDEKYELLSAKIIFLAVHIFRILFIFPRLN